MNQINEPPAGREASVSLPGKIVVSLKAGAVLAVANVLCVVIFSWAWMHVRSEAKTITVTGSAKKVIQSDLIVWSARISAIDPELPKAYETLRVSSEKVRAYLKSEGIADAQVTASSIDTTKRRARDAKGNETEKIIEYELSQSFTVSSKDVARVGEIARNVTKLIKDGVVIDSGSPRYLYTKLADLKIDMLAEATRDATTRARQIASNSGADLGAIIDAKMGVMQINAMHSNDVSSLGNSDTSSLDKEITAVVTGRFALK